MEVWQHGPRRSQLDRVDVRSRRLEQRRQTLRGEIEPVALPPQPGLLTEIGRGSRHLPDRFGFRAGHPFESGGRDHEQAAAAWQVIAVEGRILGVVEPHDEWADPGLHDRAHGFETGRQVGETIAAPHHRPRESMYAQDRFQDDAEASLGSKPQFMERRSDSRARSWAWCGESSVRHYYSQPHHQVFDAAVATGLLT